MALLEIRNATKRFGGLVANKDINLTIEKGDIVGLIGPNGAGKSTMFKSVMGFNRIDEGEIYFRGKPISKEEIYNVCRQGIACTFQHAQLFMGMTLEEAVLMGAYNRHKKKRDALLVVHRMIEFVGLTSKLNTKIHRLNMFERKKAELAAALASEPELLLLDELFAGLVPTEVELILNIVRKVNSELHITMFIVEHVLRVIMSLCNKIYVLEYGCLIASGSPEEVTSNPMVIKAYLGEDYDVTAHQ